MLKPAVGPKELNQHLQAAHRLLDLQFRVSSAIKMAPSSVSTLSNVSLGPVTLPLFKLSHCTVSGHGARMLWTHLPNRDDMFAVFDQVSSRDLGGAVLSKQILKLIRGGELLVTTRGLEAFVTLTCQFSQETIDFDSLRHQARMDRQRAQSQSVPDELLYVIMIVKRPLLALRYRLPDGQVSLRYCSPCSLANISIDTQAPTEFSTTDWLRYSP